MRPGVVCGRCSEPVEAINVSKVKYTTQTIHSHYSNLLWIICKNKVTSPWTMSLQMTCSLRYKALISYGGSFFVPIWKELGLFYKAQNSIEINGNKCH